MATATKSGSAASLQQHANTKQPCKRQSKPRSKAAGARAKQPRAPVTQQAAGGPAVPDIEDTACFTATEVAEVRSALLDWYDAGHRDLPWRHNTPSCSPAAGGGAGADRAPGGAGLPLPADQYAYRVWVGEVMSQQTQVARASAYFERWVAKWPDVAALAGASQEEVNQTWAGLGYYRRARFLLEGARHIAARPGAAFPATRAALLEVPGVGAYTAAAVASMAFGQREAVVDANVVRVLSRLRCLAGPPNSGAAAKLHARLAAQLLDPHRPGDFNQAVMELGACVCTVHQTPSCSACPISRHCRAYQAVLSQPDCAPPVTSFPVKVEATKKRQETVAVCVVERLAPPADKAAGSHFLLVRRPQAGLLAGLWEFPAQPAPADATYSQHRALLDDYLDQQLGLPLSAGSPAVQVVERRQVGRLTHVFSHIRMTLCVEQLVVQGDLEAQEEQPGADRPTTRWVAAGDMAGEGLSSSVRKVADLLAAASRPAAKRGIKRFLATAGR